MFIFANKNGHFGTSEVQTQTNNRKEAMTCSKYFHLWKCKLSLSQSLFVNIRVGY